MPSMCDNQVCDLIDLKHDCEIVRYKQVFKRKTKMDGKVQTYMTHLVVKGYG